MAMNNKPRLLKKDQPVWLGSGHGDGTKSIYGAPATVINSYMENKFKKYTVRSEHGLHSGYADSFLTVDPNLPK